MSRGSKVANLRSSRETTATPRLTRQASLPATKGPFRGVVFRLKIATMHPGYREVAITPRFDVEGFIEEARGASDRAFAIMVVAVVDEMLGRLLRASLIENPKLVDELLSGFGPLATLHEEKTRNGIYSTLRNRRLRGPRQNTDFLALRQAQLYSSLLE